MTQMIFSPAAKHISGWLIAALLLSGCNLLGLNRTATPTPTPTETPTITPTPSQTPVPTATPTRTLTPTQTLTPTITLTPSQTLTPSITPTITNTPAPTVPPAPSVRLAADFLSRVTLDPQLGNLAQGLWISYINTGDSQITATPGTPVASSNQQTIALVSTDGRTRINVLETGSSTGTRVYWSPNGTNMAYFVEDGAATGLYLLNMQNGVSFRLFAVNNLSPRGVITEPTWSPNGQTLAVALTSPWDVDIFTVNADGTDFKNISQSGGYDFYPVWSPDGTAIAFISDRDRCITYEPNVANTCYNPDGFPVEGGALYLYTVADGSVRRITDQFVVAPPKWISGGRLSYIAGDANAPSGGNTLYTVDVNSGSRIAISDSNPGSTRILREAWSADGERVVYQESAGETAVILRDRNGVNLAVLPQLTFPRFAFTAAWTLDGRRVVLGGANGQCPYGMVVIDRDFSSFALRSTAPNPGVCNPIFSPDGRFIAYEGVLVSGAVGDGRFDVYVANANGVGSRNLTGRLGGQMRLLGWVGSGQ